MSGPNSDYDPVEVTPLHAAEVEAMQADALAAIAAATTLDELKQVRLAHVGDRSPLALANREINLRLGEVYRGLPPFAMGRFGETTSRTDEVV